MPTDFQDEFPLVEDLVYLNHAAVSPWPRRASEAIQAFAAENIHHGASRYREFFSAREELLRDQLRELVNAPAASDIALLKSTSEGISVVAGGVDWKSGDNVVISAQEFPSNRFPWHAQSRHGVEVREVDLECSVPEQALMDACDSSTRVLAISSVQYASGLAVDLEVLGRFCRDRDILFSVDAIQSVGACTVDVQRIQADFLMADGHKWMLGPEGVALFYAREDKRDELGLHQYGWHMVEDRFEYEARSWSPAKSARRFECGSSNILGMHALSASISLLLETGMETVEQMISDRIDYLYQRLADIDTVTMNTSNVPERRAGILNFTTGGERDRNLQRYLVSRNIICAYRGGVRFSPHFYTPMEKLDMAIDAVEAFLQDQGG